MERMEAYYVRNREQIFQFLICSGLWDLEFWAYDKKAKRYLKFYHLQQF